MSKAGGGKANPQIPKKRKKNNSKEGHKGTPLAAKGQSTRGGQHHQKFWKPSTQGEPPKKRNAEEVGQIVRWEVKKKSIKPRLRRKSKPKGDQRGEALKRG